MTTASRINLGPMNVEVSDNQESGTGGADGYFTVATNVGFYPGARAWLAKSDGSIPRLCLITELVGSTKIGLRFVPENLNDATLRTTARYPRHGRSDLSAYVGGSVLQMYRQVAEVYQPIFDPLISVG